MRIALNVHMLFTEAPLCERFALAAGAGFDAVESWWPLGEDLGAFRGAVEESGLELALLNFDGGDPSAGDRGLAGDPQRAEAFRANVPVALELAAALGCRRLNGLVGLERPGQRERQLELAAEQVRWAAERAAAQGAEVLIEPINRFDNGPYLLDRLADAAAFVERVGRPNVRLQFDVYHAQRTEGGDLAALVERYAPLIAHVQLADSPGRGAPGSGAIDFAPILRALQCIGYRGYVSLEYRPNGPTPAALAWLPRMLRSGEHDAEQVLQYWPTG
jgi:hydroxypyruvate isomerase